jgi:Homeodomain-like domain
VNYQLITANQKQRYHCKLCFRQFIAAYFYQGCRQEVRRLILLMTRNGSSISDIARVLQISPNTVLKTLRQQAAALSQSPLPERLADVELDEMWALIGKNRMNNGSGMAMMLSASAWSGGSPPRTQREVVNAC